MPDKLACLGSTSEFYRIREGVVLKSPARVWEQSSAYQKLTDTIAENFLIERQILEALGDHPRIVRSVLKGLDVLISIDTSLAIWGGRKTTQRACFSLKPASVVFNGISTRTTAFLLLFEKDGVDKSLSQFSISIVEALCIPTSAQITFSSMLLRPQPWTSGYATSVVQLAMSLA